MLQYYMMYSEALFTWEQVAPGTRVTLFPEASLPRVYVEKRCRG